MGDQTALLGASQLEWLKTALAKSRATWKTAASDLPIGLVAADGAAAFDAFANAEPGAPLGRELEVASLLRHLKQHCIRNIVWSPGPPAVAPGPGPRTPDPGPRAPTPGRLGFMARFVTGFRLYHR